MISYGRRVQEDDDEHRQEPRAHMRCMYHIRRPCLCERVEPAQYWPTAACVGGDAV